MRVFRLGTRYNMNKPGFPNGLLAGDLGDFGDERHHSSTASDFLQKLHHTIDIRRTSR